MLDLLQGPCYKKLLGNAIKHFWTNLNVHYLLTVQLLSEFLYVFFLEYLIVFYIVVLF